MPIQLNVPQISGRVIAEVETRPARVEQWLSELPLLNIAETARKVLSQLSLYNRMAIEPQNRFEVAELYRYTTNQLTLELQKQYIGLPLPLPDKSKGIAEHARQMQLEMAFAYKWVVLELSKLGDAEIKHKHARTLSLAAQRAVHYLTEAIVISYESYSPPPIGHWLEIHTLYRYADSLGLAETVVDDICNRATQKSSVANAYKQALLLDVSDPYHLNARQVDKIYQYLDRWAHLATILPAQVNFDPTCQFLVDLTADRSGVLYTPDTLLEDPGVSGCSTPSSWHASSTSSGRRSRAASHCRPRGCRRASSSRRRICSSGSSASGACTRNACFGATPASTRRSTWRSASTPSTTG